MILSPRPYWVNKPPMGARINTSHPFAKDLSFILPLNEVGTIGQYAPASSVLSFPVSTINIGCPYGVNPGIVKEYTAVMGQGGISNSPYWNSNREGRCITFDQTDCLGYVPSRGFYMTDKITVAVIRRKLDTTIRAGAMLYQGDSALANYIGLYLPFADGNIYWDFGPLAGGRLTISGLSFGTEIERWVFTAGPLGSHVYRNGIEVGGDTTARTRTVVATGDTYLGNTRFLNDGDKQDINFFQVNATQWSAEMAKWWCSQPYDHLYTGAGASRAYAGFAEDPVAPQWRSALVHSGANSSLWEETTENTTGITDFNADGLEFGSSLSKSGSTTKWFAFKSEGEISIGSLTPTVNAGPDQFTEVFTALMAGTAGAGNYPCAVLTQLWSFVSGPAAVVFSDATVLNPTVTFTQTGVYVLRLTANNGAETASDDVTITVSCAEPIAVNAGPAQTVLFGTVVQLHAIITTLGGSFVQLWTKLSGPGTATFSDDEILEPTVTFSAAGVYTLQFSVTSTCQTVTDTVVITVLGDCVLPSPAPTFDCE